MKKLSFRHCFNFRQIVNKLYHKSGLPDDTVPLENQVAGHFYGKCNNKCYVLRHCSSGDILKPIIDVRSERELQLYGTIWNTVNDNDVVITKLRQFVPQFNGIFVAQNGQRFMRLSNITKDLVNPSILDVKIGAITYDIEANNEKIANETEKYAFAQQIGFRVLGMRTYNSLSKSYTVKDKEYGKSLTPDNITEAIILFVGDNKALIKEYYKQLNAINEWFCRYNTDRWRFISSSLLFVHDCDHRRVTIKMIDFAHVFPNKGCDDNYIFGLKNIIKYFYNIIK